MNFQELSIQQKKFLQNPENTSIKARKAALIKLKSAIKTREKDILEALFQDMQKSDFEAFSSEIGFVYQEITHTLKH